jgi:hypothetical protein
LIYANAALFVFPPSTGYPQQLVLRIRSVLEYICLERLDESEVKFFIWVYFLAGIGAENTPERLWFVERLRRLLLMEGILRWSEIKSVVMSFLWVGSVCDEGGMNLWDEVARGF